ncbi:hypothetical protein ANN_25815 [Periplaneta americana]|uniref:Uncharacterized protein n=1 Tax=Periplaneta americana TaxID=6978 RepID=A0ABQ8S4M4_PERAM|nr:hypothetical protein ANN_25815 [Periplaneta americana]
MSNARLIPFEDLSLVTILPIMHVHYLSDYAMNHLALERKRPMQTSGVLLHANKSTDISLSHLTRLKYHRPHPGSTSPGIEPATSDIEGQRYTNCANQADCMYVSNEKDRLRHKIIMAAQKYCALNRIHFNGQRNTIILIYSTGILSITDSTSCIYMREEAIVDYTGRKCVVLFALKVKYENPDVPKLECMFAFRRNERV